MHAHIAAMIAALSKPTGPDDERTQEQREYDALGHVAERFLAEGALPDVATVRPHVILTSTHAGLHGEEGTEAPHLDGVGAVSSATAQMLCCDAEITHVLLGEDGEPVSVGRYRAGPAGRHPAGATLLDPGGRSTR